MSSFPNNNYSDYLEQYRQSGNICAYLNLTLDNDVFSRDEPEWVEELIEKFAAFQAAGFHLSSSNNTFLEFLVPSILRQIIVSRCSYEYQLLTMDPVHDDMAAMFAKGYVSPMLPELILPSSLALLAILFNISLLIVTARKISMSIVCNWLIAFDSFCQIPAMMPLLVNLIAVCIGSDSVDYRFCLASLMLSTGFSYASFMAIYLMSLERLLITMMPMRMSQISDKTVKRCSLLAFLACICFGIVMVLIVFNVNLYTNLYFISYVYCNIGFFAKSQSMYYISHTIFGLSLINYVLIVCLIVWRRIYVPSKETDLNTNAAYTQETHRMLRSVFIISFVLMFGWLIGSAVLEHVTWGLRMLTERIGEALFPGPVPCQFGVPGNETCQFKTPGTPSATFGNNLFTWLCCLIISLFPLTAGINAPVLIINNADYRTAYKNTLKSLQICRKRRSPPAAVGPMFA